MSQFLQETLNLHSANRGRESELLEALRQVEAEKAQVERRHDAIVVSAFRAAQLDLSEVGHEALLGHLLQLKSKSQDASFKKAAARRAGAFLNDFLKDVSIRGSLMTFGIDPEIDMHSTTPVPVIARIAGPITQEQEQLLEKAGLTVKISASNRSPMTIADGEISTGSIVELARSLGARFDHRPDRNSTPGKTLHETIIKKEDDEPRSDRSLELQDSEWEPNDPQTKPAPERSFPGTSNFSTLRGALPPNSKMNEP